MSCDGAGRPRDGLRWRMAVGLLAVAYFADWNAEGYARASDPPPPSSCIETPTARCVIALTIAAAAGLGDGDADARAQALARVAAARVESGPIPEARASLRRALAAAAAIDGTAFVHGTTAFPEDEAFHARAQVLAEIAQAFARLDEPAKAREILSNALHGVEGVVLSRYRSWSLVAIARGQLALGALDAARRTLARADLARNAKYFWDLHKIVRMQAEFGDVEGALVTARSIGADTARNRSLAEIADVRASAGDLAGAFVTAEGIGHSYFRMLAMHAIGVARAEKGDVAGAWDAVGEIVGIWDRARDGKAGSRDVTILQADTVTAIVDAHAAAGRFRDALEATEGISDDFAFVEAHAAIARAQIAATRLDAARTTAEAMCRGHRYGRQCVEVLADLAVVQSSVGRTEEAAEVLSRAFLIAGRVLLDQNRSRAFLALYSAKGRMGDIGDAGREFESALTAANQIADTRERAEALTGIAIAALREDDRANAELASLAGLTTIRKIDDVGKRVSEFLRVGLAQRNAGNDHGALRAISKAVSASLAAEREYRRALALADVGFALAAGRLWASDGLF